MMIRILFAFAVIREQEALAAEFSEHDGYL
jgi:hypothetical protein